VLELWRSQRDSALMLTLLHSIWQRLCNSLLSIHLSIWVSYLSSSLLQTHAVGLLLGALQAISIEAAQCTCNRRPAATALQQHGAQHGDCWLLLHPDRGAEYCDDSVFCLFICLSPEVDVQSVHVTYGCGSVILWRWRDMLCTSGFMGDVIPSRKPRQLIVAAKLIGCKRRVEYPVLASGLTGLLSRGRSLGLLGAWSCWIFMTSCLHIMSMCIISTRKWHK